MSLSCDSATIKKLFSNTFVGTIEILQCDAGLNSRISLPTESTFPRPFYFMGTISALRFSARPASVSLGAIGFLYPKPTVEIRDA
ncbi:MAG: hypothetical protein BROFUL_03405 [Candidatus Brocadia fulgida]|uniref:Uncharacterized protein n=1 Tax=Candidatus Brocadia fulgida TaxID=380242 RepID=A0A0M2UTU0_9BACT|nr:MAG: hypothetical protein BROFUL_03405 [Candidatus Brocadia fulgida]MBV6519018.1 hypothetical protein [Candidatus Brocadia fulgida]